VVVVVVVGGGGGAHVTFRIVLPFLLEISLQSFNWPVVSKVRGMTSESSVWIADEPEDLFSFCVGLRCCLS
jgi:hypothetical protein